MKYTQRPEWNASHFADLNRWVFWDKKVYSLYEIPVQSLPIYSHYEKSVVIKAIVFDASMQQAIPWTSYNHL